MAGRRLRRRSIHNGSDAATPGCPAAAGELEMRLEKWGWIVEGYQDKKQEAGEVGGG